MPRTSVLVLNHEPLEERLTGPSIRNWEMAGVLSRTCEVTLAGLGPPRRSSPDFEITTYDGGRMQSLVAGHDVVVAYGYLLEKFPEIAAARHLAVDLYGPFVLENLHMHKHEKLADQHRIAVLDRGVLLRLCRQADVFLCASDRQRDFWIGWLTAAGRVNPEVHAWDPGLEKLVRIVPFGLPDQPPERGPAAIRGVIPGIAPGDFLALWAGGIWNWFDPLVLIRAVDRVKENLPQVRLLFMATASPNADTPPMRMSAQAARLADELGLTGKHVFFGGAWVPYEKRGSMLLEADVGVSTHLLDVETRYSWRTRLLDFLWAGLPILTTEGDSLADLVAVERLGATVRPGDVDAVAAALLELATNPAAIRACGRRSRSLAARFRWSTVLEPLVDYCRDPFRAPDREALAAEDVELRPTPAAGAGSPSGGEARRMLKRGWETLRGQGVGALAAKSANYVRKRR